MIQRIVQWANWKDGSAIYSTPQVESANRPGTLITDNEDVLPFLSLTPAVVECYLLDEKIYFNREQAELAEAAKRRGPSRASFEEGRKPKKAKQQKSRLSR